MPENRPNPIVVPRSGKTWTCLRYSHILYFDLPPEPLRELPSQSITVRGMESKLGYYFLFLGKIAVLVRVHLDGFDGDLWKDPR